MKLRKQAVNCNKLQDFLEKLYFFTSYLLNVIIQMKNNTGEEMKKREKKNLTKLLLSLVTVVCVAIAGYYANDVVDNKHVTDTTTTTQTISFNLEDIPEFEKNTPYVTINNNIPNFSDEYFTTNFFETYSELDELGRCGVCFANIGTDIMPTEERGAIGSIKPSGWHTVKYDIVDGKYLYNRCHLIGYQLTGENANEKNLITGTRYMNVEGMLPFENKVADYINETSNHVLYRVTPIFKENNLLANGVQIEAESVEDKGEGVLFNVYVYNNQPGIEINYTTGESMLEK